MRPLTRRQFLANSFSAAVGATGLVHLPGAAYANSQPKIAFPTAPRERIAVASYPFRDFIAGNKGNPSVKSKIEFTDFAAHVRERFNIGKIEPWSAHFPSTEEKYLKEFRAAVERAGGAIVNIAVDGEHSPYAADKEERDASVTFSKQWVDVAAAIGSPSIRTNMSPAKDSEPHAERAAKSMKQVAEYAAGKNIVVNLENDNPVSEDPFFIAKVIEQVNSPWLHALPDFANTLATGKTEYAYRGIAGMFPRAYNICHVKALEVNDSGEAFRVDMVRTFGILREANYRGYCSMEFDSPGDPYKGTGELIEMTVRYLS